jgi:hypothetical protein
MAVKTEDELLDLIAKTYSLSSVEHIKDYLSQNIVYDIYGIKWPPIFGKGNVCAELERWFNYNRLFDVTVDTIRYGAEEISMAYVSVKVDFDEVGYCILIEEEGGLITRIYVIKPDNTGRVRFQKIKKWFFMPRLMGTSKPKKTTPPTPKERNT